VSNAPNGHNGKSIIPSHFQPELPLERLILKEKPGGDAVPMDVIFVGGGPAGLSGAIELAKLVKEDAAKGGGIGPIEIGVLEKANDVGEHCLSGAVVNPVSFRELFPDLKDSDFPFRTRVERDRVYLLTESSSIRIPAPPTMHNVGSYVASISEIARWLGEKAKEMGVNVFTGFPADSLLVDGDQVLGVRTTPAGLDRKGERGTRPYQPPSDLSARITVLCEGTRGTLTQAFLKWQKIGSPNPQIFALGVKELWETKSVPDAVIHTLGWPLPRQVFGGTFLYPMDKNLISFGVVMGLDYHDSHFDPHAVLQRFKNHPLLARYLEGGELQEWGAKTLPEGGYYAIPERLHGNGLLVCGDAAGFVNVATLKGIHYAMKSGMLAARTIFDALKANDTTPARLSAYDALIKESYIERDLYKTRNMRLAFKSGFYVGGMKASFMTVTGGAFPGGKISTEPDADEPREPLANGEDKAKLKFSLSKMDAVFRSGNSTRDDIPSHLIVGKDVTPEVAEFYHHLCPAGVYELEDGKLTVTPSNCVDCKATDVLGPRWSPREGGSGPRYRRM
jgi:electron-transferring-flavoprotein dehydrogenase